MRSTAEIKLRVIAFARNGHIYVVSLDTNQIVRGESFDEVKKKMKDALTVYMKSFSADELDSNKYVRLAPLRYRVVWNLMMTMGRAFKAWATLLDFIYDPQSERLKLA